MAKIPAIIAKIAVNPPFVTKESAADEGVELVSAALVAGVLSAAELVAGVVTVAEPDEAPAPVPVVVAVAVPEAEPPPDAPEDSAAPDVAEPEGRLKGTE